MRRPRHRLQVSTFPFLAVLLCAMGSLILLLLVIDRRAKIVARLKARRAEMTVRDEREQRDRERRQEWERQRDALHRALEEDAQEVRQELARAESQLTGVLGQVSDLEAASHDLQHKIAGAKQELAKTEASLAGSYARSRQDEKELERRRDQIRQMMQQLQELEKAQRDLERARKNAKPTYSLVPYRGKQGTNRRPIYLECKETGWVFHPEKRAIADSPETADQVRGEVIRRVKELRQSAGGESGQPYLLVMVRPTGIVSYYHLLSAVRGADVDLGYELIEEDWELDFNPSANAAGVGAGQGAGGAGTGGPVFPGGDPGRGHGAIPGKGSVSGGGPVVGLRPPTHVGGAAPGDGGGGRNAFPGSGEGPGTVGGRPGPVSLSPPFGAPGGGPTQGGTGQSASPTGSGGTSPPTMLGGPTADGRATRPDAAGAGTGKSGTEADGSPEGDRKPNDPRGRAEKKPEERETPPDQQTAARQENPAGGGQGTASGGQGGSGSGIPGGGPGGEPPAPRLPRLTGSRDWLIRVECDADGVHVPAASFHLPSAELSPGSAGMYRLRQTLVEMIARRQKSRLPGDPPYRPQIRFRVRPDGLRGYYTVFPVLESLQIPMKRENAEEMNEP